MFGLLGAGLTPVHAQQQTGTLTSIGDGQIPLLSSGWTTLNAGEQAAYSFDFGTAGETVNVWMNVAPPNGATLELWTSDAYAGLTAGQTGGTALATGTLLEGAPGLITLQEPLGSVLEQVPASGGTMGNYRDFVVELAYTTDKAVPLLISLEETDAGDRFPAIDKTVVPAILYPAYSAVCS